MDFAKENGRFWVEPDQVKAWATVTAAAIREVLRAAGLSDDLHINPGDADEAPNERGCTMSTNKKVISVVLPPELEKKIYELRGHEELARCSIGEIVRRMIVIGLANKGGLTNCDDLTE